MKVKFIFLSLFLCSVSVMGQQDFTTMHVPAIGTSVPYKYESGSSLSPGPAGNQTWDFSGLSFSTHPLAPNESYTDPSGSIYTASDISVSNLAQKFYSWSSTGQTYHGEYGSASNYEYYSDPAIMITLPMSYNETDVDTYSGNGAFSVGPNAGSTTYSNGSVSTTYDGYGTIITNNGTFSDVVRIKSVFTHTTTYNATSATDDQTDTYYNWFSRTTGKLIFTFVETLTVSSSGSGSSKLVFSYNPVTTSIFSPEQQAPQFTVSPNPSIDKILIHSQGLESGEYTMRILNQEGNVVREEVITIGANDILVETSQLAEGLYYINLSSGIISQSLKFLKKL